MREVLIDTETTGLSPKTGHRIIEIGCIEVIDGVITGKTYHQYINPEREVELAAEEVHGISDNFLKDKPLFQEIADDFLSFVDNAVLVAHNASFDVGFLNAEMLLIGKEPIDRNSTIIDTLAIARKCFPRQKNNLDALCERLDVDCEHRDLHGALLDAGLLAEVYLNLKKHEFFEEA